MSAPLSAYDLMELLVFAHKVKWERSFSYAHENYPPRFERDNYQPTADAAVLRSLMAEYREQLDDVQARDNYVDLHNAHIDESYARESARRLVAIPPTKSETPR